MRLRRLKQLHEDESGIITAYFVVITLVLFGIIAFALDVGLLHLQRRVAQNAADPGSFAGAAYLDRCTLWDGETNPEEVAEEFALNNLQGIGDGTLVAADEVFATVVEDGFSFTDGLGTVTYDTVYTRVDRQQSYLFGRVLGLESANVPAEAEAACLPTAGLAVCPFYLQAPNPDWTVEDGGDPFGLQLGMVYRFKEPAQAGTGGNRGFLGIYGPGGNVITTGVRNGCVPPNGELDIEFEGGETLVTDPKPGTMGNPLWAAMNDLYNYEGDPPYPSHTYCDISFDAGAFVDSGNYAFTPPTDPLVDQKLVDCRADPNPDDNVQGRWWPILITTDPCNGNNCPLQILSVAIMYVACWGPGPTCDGSNPANAGLFGIFSDHVPFELPASGISNSPLTPQRVRLVR